MEEIRGEETLNEPVSSSEPPGFGSLQHLASTETKKSDCLEDTGAVTRLDATGTTRGQPANYKHTEDINTTLFYFENSAFYSEHTNN